MRATHRLVSRQTMSTPREHVLHVPPVSDDEDRGDAELIFGLPRSVLHEVARAAAFKAATRHVDAGRLRPTTDPVAVRMIGTYHSPTT